MRKIRIANQAGRDATVAYETLQSEDPPTMGLPNENIRFRRYLAAAPSGTDDALEEAHGDDYAQALIDGDPDVDIEVVGRKVGPTDNVFLNSQGEVLYAPPEIVEVILEPDGSEKERREPVDVLGNVNDALPIRWTKMRLKRGELVALCLSTHPAAAPCRWPELRLPHNMAKELDEADDRAFMLAVESVDETP